MWKSRSISDAEVGEMALVSVSFAIPTFQLLSRAEMQPVLGSMKLHMTNVTTENK
jgi:hypothetical protein